MRAASEQANLQAVGSRGNGPRPPGNGPGRSYHYVLAKDYIGFRETLKKSGIDHRLRTFRRFFPWLEDRHQGTVPLRSSLGEQFCGAREPCDVHVMATHVRDRHGVALAIGD